MNFQELVRKRFSARNYRPDEVETSKLDYILECARLAPSAVNFQPWKFLVIKSERLFALKYEGTDARIIEVGAGDYNDVICAAIAIE